MEEFDWVMGAVIPYINFALFLFLAVKFFRKRLNNIALKRRGDYEKLFAEAQQAEQAARAIHEELQNKKQNIENEMQQLINSSKSAAAKEKETTINEAKQVAEHIKVEAKRVAAAEVEQARISLRDEIMAEVKKGVTSKFINELNPESQKALIKKKVSQLKQSDLGVPH